MRCSPMCMIQAFIQAFGMLRGVDDHCCSAHWEDIDRSLNLASRGGVHLRNYSEASSTLVRRGSIKIQGQVEQRQYEALEARLINYIN